MIQSSPGTQYNFAICTKDAVTETGIGVDAGGVGVGLFATHTPFIQVPPDSPHENELHAA